MSKPEEPKAAAAAECTALVPRDFNEAKAMADYLSPAALLPAALRNKNSDVCLIIMTGQELGLGPTAALRGIHVVKGKPVLSADMMAALVVGSGLAEYFTQIEADDTHAVYETKRKGSPTPVRAQFTMEDAARAKLLNRGDNPGEDNWSKYPGAMCRARAKSILAREVYPDLLMGLYSEAEADWDAPEEFCAPAPPSEAVVEAEVVEVVESTEPAAEPKAEPPDEEDIATEAYKLREAIEMAQTTQELVSLVVRLKALPDRERTELRTAYSARRAALRQEGSQ